MAFTFIKTTYKYGIIMGLGFCVYTTIGIRKSNECKQAGLFKLGRFIASVLVLLTLIALISLFFIRENK